MSLPCCYWNEMGSRFGTRTAPQPMTVAGHTRPALDADQSVRRVIAALRNVPIWGRPRHNACWNGGPLRTSATRHMAGCRRHQPNIGNILHDPRHGHPLPRPMSSCPPTRQVCPFHPIDSEESAAPARHEFRHTPCNPSRNSKQAAQRFRPLGFMESEPWSHFLQFA